MLSIRNLLISLCGVAFAGSANAALIELDDPVFGASPDGFNITRDTASGLDWLDASLTDSLKFVDVDAGPLTPAWRRATIAEIITLFGNAGLRRPVTNAILTDFAVNLGSPLSLINEGVTEAQFVDIFRAAEDLIMMLGVTGGNNQDSFVTIGTTSDSDSITPTASAVAVLDIFFSPFVTQPTGGCLGVLDPGCFPLAVSIFAPSVGAGIGDDGGRGDTGHFLVRNTPTSSDAPAPGAAILFLFGLVSSIGLASRRR